MANTLWLGEELVQSAEAFIKVDSRKFLGGAMFVYGVVSGLADALRILEASRRGGKVPEEVKTRMQVCIETAKASASARQIMESVFNPLGPFI